MANDVIATRTVIAKHATASGGNTQYVMQVPTDAVLEKKKKEFASLKTDAQRLSYLRNSNALMKDYVHYWWAKHAGGDAKKNEAIAKLK